MEKENKKQNVSLRMSAADLRRINEIASRLQVRKSDVCRFAVRTALSKLSPLNDPTVAGKDLLPVFMEFGPALIQYFDLDSKQLEAIINGAAVGHQRVDKEDIELLGMAGLKDQYIYMRLREMINHIAEPASAAALVQEYLMQKYVRSAPVDGFVEPVG